MLFRLFFSRRHKDNNQPRVREKSNDGQYRTLPDNLHDLDDSYRALVRELSKR